jgi:hypothetical protein
MKKGMQPTVFIGVLILLLTLMVLESDATRQNINRPTPTQK